MDFNIPTRPGRDPQTIAAVAEKEFVSAIELQPDGSRHLYHIPLDVMRQLDELSEYRAVVRMPENYLFAVLPPQ
ncbi:MAG: hypothetical protein GXP63_05105 [DPANN group archaeon]|nr:hypothetical protein [DPANN group archaeon]